MVGQSAMGKQFFLWLYIHSLGQGIMCCFFVHCQKARHWLNLNKISLLLKTYFSKIAGSVRHPDFIRCFYPSGIFSIQISRSSVLNDLVYNLILSKINNFQINFSISHDLESVLVFYRQIYRVTNIGLDFFSVGQLETYF